MRIIVMLSASAIVLGQNAYASVELPRVSAVYWGKQGPEDEIRQIGKFNFVIVGLSGSKARMQSMLSTMLAETPGIKLGTYTVLVEFWKNPQPSNAQNFPNFVAIEENDWWLYNADGQRVQWSREYKTHLVNITRWTRPDHLGRRYPEWLAEHKASYYRELKGLEYVFVDNLWYSPRPKSASMDWERNGRPRANSDPQVQSAFRQGLLDYMNALRKALPGVKLIGNADNDLDYPEFKGQLEGAYLECSIGRNWSIENRSWETMMGLYRKALANTKPPHDVILEACGDTRPDLRLMRYGLTSALLENGWFGYKIQGVGTPFYADEYSAPLGKPSEAPPRQPESSSGIWSRKYTNGMVLVNPGTSSATIEVGAGYKRLKGAQAPEVNDGMPASRITLGPKDGIVLLKSR